MKEAETQKENKQSKIEYEEGEITDFNNIIKETNNNKSNEGHEGKELKNENNFLNKKRNLNGRNMEKKAKKKQRDI